MRDLARVGIFRLNGTHVAALIDVSRFGASERSCVAGRFFVAVARSTGSHAYAVGRYRRSQRLADFLPEKDGFT